MTKIIHQPHDKFFKQSMADIQVARDFFQVHLPKKLLEIVNLDTLELEKESFIDEVFKATDADVLYSVKAGETLVYLYLLCEAQCENDPYMAFRIWLYVTRIMEMHRKKYPGAPLPLVYPMVVYFGEECWNSPMEIYPLFGEHEALARELMFQPYELIDIHRTSDSELKKHVWQHFPIKNKPALDEGSDKK